jgi:hypothetical protein
MNFGRPLQTLTPTLDGDVLAVLPELVSVPLFYEWLRKPFRRKDTPASR